MSALWNPVSFPELMMLEGDEKVEKTAVAMVESALDHVKILEDMDFTDIKISLKASDVPTTSPGLPTHSRPS